MSDAFRTVVTFINRGGFTMWMLFLCSVLMLAVICERLYSLWKINIDSHWLLQQMALSVQAKKITETIQYLRRVPGVLPKVLEAGLHRYEKSKEEIEGAMSNALTEYTPILDRYVGVLGTIAVISPFLGLLGTILGIIKAFERIAMTNITGPAVIAEGIYEALYTTAAGLIIAIPAVIFYNYFKDRVNGMITDMEVCSNKLVEMIVLSRKNEPFPDDLIPKEPDPFTLEK